MKTQPSSQDNILALTGIRAVACILVIFCHCSNNGFGHVETFSRAATPSVYLFFVLSGYLLMRSGLFQIQSSRDAVPQRFINLKLISYLVRRFMRIYPAYLTAILIYKIMTWYARSGNFHENYFEELDHSIWSSLYFCGMQLHFWTLRIEMLFFLTLLPIILVLTAEFKVLDHKRFRHSRYKSSYFFYLIVTIIISCIQYSYGNTRGGTLHKSKFWVHVIAFWHGCLGGIASYHLNIFKIKILLPRWVVELISWAIILRLAFGNRGVIKVHTSMNPYSRLFNPFFQTPFKAALLLIFEFTHDRNSIAQALSLPLFQYLGKISYSTYLMHMFALTLFKMHTNIREVEGNVEVMILSFFCGALLYHAVEARGVKYGEEFIRGLKGSSKKYEEMFRRWVPGLKISSSDEVASDIESAGLKYE